MEHEIIRIKIVKNGGYMTLAQLKKSFQGEDMEILEMKLTFLVNKNMIREIIFQSPDGPDNLYYIPRQQ